MDATCQSYLQVLYTGIISPKRVSRTDQLWTRAVHATDWNTGEKAMVSTGSRLDREVLIAVKIRAAVVPKRGARSHRP